MKNQARSHLILLLILLIPFLLGAQSVREDSLLHILPRQKTDSLRIITLNELFKISYSNDPISARAYATQGLKLARQTGQRELISRMCNNLGVLESEGGNYKESLRYHKEALSIREADKDSANITGSLLNMGNVYYKLGDYERAIQNYMVCTKLYSARRDTAGFLWSVGNIGTIYNEQGKFTEALKVYLHVLNFQEKIDDRINLAGMEFNVGNVYLQMEMFEDAVGFMNRALKNYQKENDLFGLIDVLQSLGEIRREMKEPEEARAFFEKALSIADSVSDQYGQATCSMSLSSLAADEGDYEKALRLLNQALHGYQNMGRKKGEAEALCHIGWVLLAQGKFQKSLSPLKRSLILAKELKTIGLERDNYELLAEAEDSLGNYANAYQYFRNYFALFDSISSDVKAGQIAELNTRYKTRERKSEIVRLNLERAKDQLRITRSTWRIYFLLGCLIIVFLVAFLFHTRYRQKQKRNEEIGKINDEVEKQRDRLGEQNRQIREINANLERMVEVRTTAVLKAKNELDTFLYESAHALRRPLTRIEGLIQLLSKEQNEGEKESLQEKLAFTVHSMDRLLHKLIMVNENERRDVIIEKIDFAQMVREVSIEVGTGEVEIALEIEEELELFSDAYLVKTLLRNLMENACQFHPDTAAHKPNVVVRLLMTDTEVILEIEDNGMGIPDAQQESVFEMFYRGYARSGSSGLGLYVARKISARLHGTISIKPMQHKGTNFEVRFPRHFM